MKEEIKKLEDERARVASEIAAIENRLSCLRGELLGYERSLAIMSREPVPSGKPLEPRRERARNVKEAVLAQIQDAGHKGLTVNDLMERTARDNVHLERGTVSSLLSRFKREGVLGMEEGKYFFPKLRAEAEMKEALFN